MLKHTWAAVWFTTSYAISAYHYYHYEFESHSGEVYSIRHYVIMLVTDLWQVGGFLRVLRLLPPIKLTATIQLKYCWKPRPNLNHTKNVFLYKLTLEIWQWAFDFIQLMQSIINNTDNIWHWKQIKPGFDIYSHNWRRDCHRLKYWERSKRHPVYLRNDYR